MKKFKRILAVSLLILCVSILCPVSALAADEWSGTWVEQYSSNVPSVDLYIYPHDSYDEVVYGLNNSSVNISASLGGEQLIVESFDRISDEGTMYIVLLNTSNNNNPDVTYQFIDGAKKELSALVDTLKPNDKLLLVTYDSSCTVQLDGSESASAAKRIISDVDLVSRGADTLSALKEAVRLSQLDANSTPDRKVVLMFDYGNFLSDSNTSGTLLEDTLDSLLAADLPVYSLCYNTSNDIQEQMHLFTNLTGGYNCPTKASAVQNEAIGVLNWINSCYVLKLKTDSNIIEPRQRTLTVTFDDIESTAIQMDITITGNVPDMEPPKVEEITCEGSTINLRYSERVVGAEFPGNYEIFDKRGNALAISDVSYSDADYTASILLENSLKDGNYTIKISGVTDYSNESNAVSYPSGENAYSFSVGNGINIFAFAIIGVAAAVVIVLVVVILMKKKKKDEERQQLQHQQEIMQLREEIAASKKIQQIKVTFSVVLPDGTKTSASAIVGQKFSVGHKSNCDLAINDSKISRLHLILSYDNGKLTLADAGSTNGTFVNGVKVEKSRQILNGDVIRIGETTITIKY